MKTEKMILSPLAAADALNRAFNLDLEDIDIKIWKICAAKGETRTDIPTKGFKDTLNTFFYCDPAGKYYVRVDNGQTGKLATFIKEFEEKWNRPVIAYPKSDGIDFSGVYVLNCYGDRKLNHENRYNRPLVSAMPIILTRDWSKGRDYYIFKLEKAHPSNPQTILVDCTNWGRAELGYSYSSRS